jgi:hypothetical protein
MVRLRVLSGKMAGLVLPARHFPFRLGRGPQMNGRFEDDGVWDFHLELRLDPRQGFILRRHAEARATINGQAFEEQLLRNGDLVEMGAVKLRFSLSETIQKGQCGRIGMTGLLFAGVLTAEIGLIYWLADLFLRPASGS